MKDNLYSKICTCGKEHLPANIKIITQKNAIKRLSELLSIYKTKKPFIIADINTYEAAGKEVCYIVESNNLQYSLFLLKDKHLEPNEKTIGAAFMNFDSGCDIIIAVGSGVINDIGKLLSVMTGKKYIAVATAASMDGYASASSSVIRDGVKVSLSTRSADAIIGDIDVLRNAPLHMLKSGIGDMLAKYISIAEWKIANIITGEYYCEAVAELVRKALHECIQNIDGVLSRDEKSVESVFRGLITAGEAMTLAGVSRPASGVEHYFSHIWDMRGVEFHTPTELHGIQCGVAALYSARVYEQISKLKTVDKEMALRYVDSFDFNKHQKLLRDFIGSGAEAMISSEKNDGKYDKEKHRIRLSNIIKNWESILYIIKNEIPSSAEIENILEILEMPRSCSEFGISEKELPLTFSATKDIRDKYVASRLCFDIGIIDKIVF